jgi:hypothetical protein
MASRAPVHVADPPRRRRPDDTGSVPVFVDHTGTRRRWYVVLAVGSGALLSVVAVALAVAFLGGGGGVLPGLPGNGAGPAVTTAGVTGSHPGSGQTARPGASSGTRTTPDPGGTAGATPTGAANPAPGTTHRSHSAPTQTPSKRN